MVQTQTDFIITQSLDFGADSKKYVLQNTFEKGEILNLS